MSSWLLISFVLIMVSTAPSAYIQSAYPEARPLIVAQFILGLAIVSLGDLVAFLASGLVAQFSNRLPNLRFAVVALLGIICFYPIYSARNIYVQIPIYQRWASYWDKRDQDIRLARQDGIADVEVMKIDHVIPNVSELNEDAGFWYNVCAAGYYGVQSIRTDKPGWDTP
jgi:MFS family permease